MCVCTQGVGPGQWDKKALFHEICAKVAAQLTPKTCAIRKCQVAMENSEPTAFKETELTLLQS